MIYLKIGYLVKLKKFNDFNTRIKLAFKNMGVSFGSAAKTLANFSKISNQKPNK